MLMIPIVLHLHFFFLSVSQLQSMIVSKLSCMDKINFRKNDLHLGEQILVNGYTCDLME